MQHITSETKRRLALGLAPALPKNRNRRRRQSIDKIKLALVLSNLALLAAILILLLNH